MYIIYVNILYDLMMSHRSRRSTIVPAVIIDRKSIKCEGAIVSATPKFIFVLNYNLRYFPFDLILKERKKLSPSSRYVTLPVFIGRTLHIRALFVIESSIELVVMCFFFTNIFF